MSSQPFMQLYVADYMADTMHLNTEQHGAYLLLLMTMWRHGGELPDDPKKLARICRTTPRKWPAIWSEIGEFFEVKNGVVSNQRLTKEYQKAKAKSELRADAGSRGGKAKALKYNNGTVAKASDLPKQCQISEPELRKREAKASPKKRGNRLPENWQLPRDWGDWAVSKGWPETVIRSEAEKFKDYWVSKSGAGATKLNWQAVWRNWMRNSKSPKSIEGGGYARTSKSATRLDAFIAGASGTS